MRISKYIIPVLILFFAAGCQTPPPVAKDTAFAIKGPTFLMGNVQYVPLETVISNFDVDYEWDSMGKTLTLYKGDRKAIVSLGSDTALVNGSLVDLDAPMRMKDGTLAIPYRLASQGLPMIFHARPRVTDYDLKKLKIGGEYSIARVVIDAGHGGKDPGAMGQYNLAEKHITLDIAERLSRHLEGSGIETVMTRGDDRFISLWGRADAANKQEADFFVSIHANASTSKTPSGFEVYYLSEAVDDNARAVAASENASLKFEDSSFGNRRPSDSLEATLWDIANTENRVESIEMAQNIIRSAQNTLNTKCRGVKAARFYVLKGAKMPSVLVEVGFVTNAKDARSLKDSLYREKVARAIASGIIDYKKKYERTEGFTKK